MTNRKGQHSKSQPVNLAAALALHGLLTLCCIAGKHAELLAAALCWLLQQVRQAWKPAAPGSMRPCSHCVMPTA